ncbi:hypothetical protein DPMN_097629 [Dreissena polymorpha]|uniref:Uncharacterized protein n=1 Tax=Dreissena polymorpha TaxID=45954 RepID=A0A9D4LC31_DREPO|nr:hypothetical protein DPMN_097629 [Dreissena polymorpha]
MCIVSKAVADRRGPVFESRTRAFQAWGPLGEGIKLDRRRGSHPASEETRIKVPLYAVNFRSRP